MSVFLEVEADVVVSVDLVGVDIMVGLVMMGDSVVAVIDAGVNLCLVGDNEVVCAEVCCVNLVVVIIVDKNAVLDGIVVIRVDFVACLVVAIVDVAIIVLVVAAGMVFSVVVVVSLAVVSFIVEVEDAVK